LTLERPFSWVREHQVCRQLVRESLAYLLVCKHLFSDLCLMDHREGAFHLLKQVVHGAICTPNLFDTFLSQTANINRNLDRAYLKCRQAYRVHVREILSHEEDQSLSLASYMAAVVLILLLA